MMGRSKTSVNAWRLALLCVFALAASFVCVSAAYASMPQAAQKTQASDGALTAGQIATLEVTAGSTSDTDGEVDALGIGADIEKAQVTFTNGSTFAYTGKEIEPRFTATLKTADGKTKTLKGTTNPNDNNADFFYFYMNNVDVSLGKTLPLEDRPIVVLATFVADDPYVYVKEVPFTIKPARIKNASVRIKSQFYTGKRIKPAPTVKFQGKTLQRGKDYTVKYTKNIKVGFGRATIIGKGNFVGKKAVKFRIRRADIQSARVTNVSDRVYTGNSITPTVKVKFKGKVLKKNRDYTITYKNNRNVGDATIKIRGKGNFRSSRIIQFAIEPRSINDLSQAYVNSVTWTGDPLKPDPVMTLNGNKLKEGRDYSIRYSNNVEPGWGRAYVTARGNYTGSRTFNFEIDKQKLDLYKGSPITARTRFNLYIYEPGLQPRPIVEYKGRTLVENIDYTLYWDNSNYNSYLRAGTGYVTIYGYGSHFTGARTLSYQIVGR